MAGKAIETMQGQMLLKVRQPHKLLQGRGAHLLDDSELHMIID